MISFECAHNSLNIKHEGPLEIYICASPECAKVVEAKCEHATGVYPDQVNLCSWDALGMSLTCSYCGMDVT